MTPQEKLHWFWTLGTVPGSIFDDLNDLHPMRTRGPDRRHARRLKYGSQKPSPSSPSGMLRTWRDNRKRCRWLPMS